MYGLARIKHIFRENTYILYILIAKFMFLNQYNDNYEHSVHLEICVECSRQTGRWQSTQAFLKPRLRRSRLHRKHRPFFAMRPLASRSWLVTGASSNLHSNTHSIAVRMKWCLRICGFAERRVTWAKHKSRDNWFRNTRRAELAWIVGPINDEGSQRWYVKHIEKKSKRPTPGLSFARIVRQPLVYWIDTRSLPVYHWPDRQLRWNAWWIRDRLPCSFSWLCWRELHLLLGRQMYFYRWDLGALAAI